MMEYSMDSDTWSCRSNTMFDMTELSGMWRSRLTYLQGPRGASVFEPSSVTAHDDPTYVNIPNEESERIAYHFGDRIKGLVLFLRETNAESSTVTSLQRDIETLLHNSTNCDLATTTEVRFSTDIIIFVTMIDDRLRRIRRRSEEEFVEVSKKLTKLEMKYRSGAGSMIFTRIRRFIEKLLTRKP
ncbi:hypothetical protein Q1695_015748 [Nippostrongylus brasiliensis]|nr:hypothetical protein Q1695_015748 [Nippostrongylus brasiliensis]